MTARASRASTASYDNCKGDLSSSGLVAPTGGIEAYFCGMAHDTHDHHEPEQNEIGGPVVFALFLFAIVVVAIGMMAS
jgi:hypothetical protein